MKSTFEQMGGTYHREGEYYIPNLIVPESPVLGIWGKRRRRYLMEHHNPIYIGMLLAGTLNDHLTETDQSAEAMFSQLVAQLAEAEQVNEALKASDQMEWIRRMNNIRNLAIEIETAFEGEKSDIEQCSSMLTPAPPPKERSIAVSCGYGGGFFLFIDLFFIW